MSSLPHDVTLLLEQWSAGDPEALHRLLPLVMDDLRALARRYLAGESPAHTLQPTALVNEVYLRLERRQTVHFKNRKHFFGSLAELIRRILVDHARRQKSSKRGGGLKVSLEDQTGLHEVRGEDLLALDDALRDLEAVDPRRHQVVVLKFFGGLTQNEIASVLEVSRATVERDWTVARLRLKNQLKNSGPPPEVED